MKNKLILIMILFLITLSGCYTLSQKRYVNNIIHYNYEDYIDKPVKLLLDEIDTEGYITNTFYYDDNERKLIGCYFSYQKHPDRLSIAIDISEYMFVNPIIGEIKIEDFKKERISKVHIYYKNKHIKTIE